MKPLLLTYVRACPKSMHPEESVRVPRMTSFIRGNPFDPTNTRNAQHAMDEMEMCLRARLLNNTMAAALRESRKRRHSDESIMAAATMHLLHCGATAANPANPANPNNIGPATGRSHKRPALGSVADASAPMFQ